MGNLVTPEKVQRIQNVLYEKAKREPNFRFYSLYDKIHRPDVLEFAYRCAKANKGSPGIDGETFQMVEENGRDAWLGDLAKELQDGAYKPGPVQRIFIPKPNGKLRPLGIPNLKDRVVQTAAVIILGSIFEADLPDEQYAYRSGKNAQQAVGRVQCLMNRDRHLQVVDADLSGYFDTIPHPELIKCLARRISDGKALSLAKAWLEAPVVEKDKKTGAIKISTSNRDNRIGTPQGSPISPLFSNLYMRRFILSWKQGGFEHKYGGQIVNYADDLVICCKRDAMGALSAMRKLMERLKLTVNEDKTRTCVMPEGEFNFLGYTFKQLISFKKKKKYIGCTPSEKAIKKHTGEFHTQTAKNFGWMETSEMVKRLNQKTLGWAGYFRIGAVTKAYRRIAQHSLGRFRQWLARKHKWRTKGYKNLNDAQMCEKYGLINILTRLPTFS